MGARISQKKIKNIQIFYANGMTQSEISEILEIPKSTIGSYTKKITVLPEHMRRNPFKILNQEDVEKLVEMRIPTSKNIIEAHELGDIDYIIGHHKKGERFPLDAITKIPLRKLQEAMSEPTDFHSSLSVEDWVKYYLEGKSVMLKFAPHKFTEQQLRMLAMWSEYPRCMFETFRGAGKTVIADAILVREICENRDNCYFIMSETKAKAQKRVKQIGDILLTNKKLIADYGFLPHTTKYEGMTQTWAKAEITVKRDFKQTDPTLMCFSTESGEATGAHFAGGVFDDVWSFNLEKNSRVNKDKWFGWRDGELEGCLEENAWELFLLTRKGPTDLYQDLEDSGFYTVFREPAVLKFPSNYEILWKNTISGKKVFNKVVVNSADWEITEDSFGRFSIEFFLKKKAKLPSDKFESEYQLNPMSPKGKYWDENNLRWIDDYREIVNVFSNKVASKYGKMIGAMDLAMGKSDRADYTALTIIAELNNNYYLLDFFIKRGADIDDMAKLIFEAHKQFAPYLSSFYIEADLQQSFLVEQIKQKCSYVKIIPSFTRQIQKDLNKDDSAKRVNLPVKPARIWTILSDLILTHRLWVNKNARDVKEFKDEFRTFPSCEHFDVLDSASIGVFSMSKKSALIYAMSG